MPWAPHIQALVERHPVLRAVGSTPLVPVEIFHGELPDVEVFAKMESLNPGGSLKDRLVLRMLLGALDDGRLKPGKTVQDSSSGNARIAYAMIGKIRGVPVQMRIPDNASAERKKRMRAHGAGLLGPGLDRRARAGDRRRGVRDVRTAGSGRLLRGSGLRGLHGRRRARRPPPRPRPLRDPLQRPGRALLLDPALGLAITTS